MSVAKASVFAFGFLCTIVSAQVDAQAERPWTELLWQENIFDVDRKWEDHAPYVDSRGRTLVAFSKKNEYDGPMMNANYLNGKRMFDLSMDQAEVFWPNGVVAFQQLHFTGSGGAVHSWMGDDYDEEGRKFKSPIDSQYVYTPTTSKARAGARLEIFGSYDQASIRLSGGYDQNGLRTGMWEKQAMFSWKGEFVKGLMNGRWTFRGPEDSEEGDYKNGLREGLWSYTSNNTSETGSYREGKKVGTWLVTESSNVGSQNDPTWEVTNRFEREYLNGSLVRELQRTVAGTLVASRAFSNGTPSGLWKQYYPTGVTMAVGSYANGKEEGVWNYYGGSGLPTETRTYTGGVLNGDVTVFLAGKPALRKTFVGGTLTAEVSVLASKEFFELANRNVKAVNGFGRKAPRFDVYPLDPPPGPNTGVWSVPRGLRWSKVELRNDKMVKRDDEPFRIEHAFALPWGSAPGQVGGEGPPFRLPLLYRVDNLIWVVSDATQTIMSLNADSGVLKNIEFYSSARATSISAIAQFGDDGLSTIMVGSDFYRDGLNHWMPATGDKVLLLPLEFCVSEVCPEVTREVESQSLGIGSDYYRVQQVGPVWGAGEALLVFPSDTALEFYRVTWPPRSVKPAP